jgi:hypothetical protein
MLIGWPESHDRQPRGIVSCRRLRRIVRRIVRRMVRHIVRRGVWRDARRDSRNAHQPQTFFIGSTPPPAREIAEARCREGDGRRRLPGDRRNKIDALIVDWSIAQCVRAASRQHRRRSWFSEGKFNSLVLREMMSSRYILRSANATARWNRRDGARWSVIEAPIRFAAMTKRMPKQPECGISKSQRGYLREIDPHTIL